MNSIVRMYVMLTALCLTVLLGGCDQQSWQTTSINGLMPDLDFTLVNESGQKVDADDYSGKVRLLFFGFTHCPKACPLTLGKLSLVLNNLGAISDDARVLFVSVDPERDTPAVLDEYTDSFASQVIGLTGSQSQLQSLARRYRVAYSYGEGYPGKRYRVYHSSAVFVFDRRGEIRLIFQSNDSIEAVTHDLRSLLNESQTAGHETQNASREYLKILQGII